MYEARRGEERCTSVWGTGATQGALTSPHPSLRPPTGADRPLAALLGKTTARGRSAPPPAPRFPVSLPPHHPQPNLRSARVAACGAGCVFLPRTGHDQFSCPLRYGGRPTEPRQPCMALRRACRDSGCSSAGGLCGQRRARTAAGIYAV